MLYSDDLIRIWKFREDRTSTACIRYRQIDPAPRVMVWATTGHVTRTFLVLIAINLNSDWYIIYDQWLYSILEICEMPSFSKIIQEHMSHVLFRLSLIHRIFDCCFGLYSLQIYHPLKQSGYLLLS